MSNYKGKNVWKIAHNRPYMDRKKVLSVYSVQKYMLLDEKKNMHEIQKLFFYLEVYLSLIFVQCLTPIVHEKILEALFLFGNSSHIEIIGEK